MLAADESFTVLDTLTGMYRFSGHEPFVTFAQNPPGGPRRQSPESCPLVCHRPLCWAGLMCTGAIFRGGEPGRSGWEILVSEIMLQQTPVARVLGPWTEWVQRWPTPSAMAAASPGDVLRAWGKLIIRAGHLRLHTCAQVLAAEFGDGSRRCRHVALAARYR